jgi:predicted transcriptional regulator
MDIHQGNHQSRAFVIASDAAGGLDIFGGGFGLSEDYH